MAIYRAHAHKWKRMWLDAILHAQKQYCDWLGVGSEGVCPSPDYHNNLLFVPTEHPIFTTVPIVYDAR